MEIKGKFAKIDIKASIVDEATLAQLQAIADNVHYSNTKIVVMPDTHAGAECVIGFTMQYDPHTPIINPNIVGVDISCGMLVQPLGKVDLDFKKFDATVQGLVNSEKCMEFENDFYAEVDTQDKPFEYHNRQIGTLGFGNHFVEVDADADGEKYLVIHTGSRHLGYRVCNYYAKKCMQGILCSGDDVKFYLHDMGLVQQYASLNRAVLMDAILSAYGASYDKALRFETLHNYIDLERHIIRKGAISAQKGEQVLIPLNMRDGSVICTGKGNADWNWSAPHGAGRVMSRSEAKRKVTLEDYAKSMDGIYSTCINADTIDECAMAYKPSEVILADIQDTVEVHKVIKPIYNFKNSK